MDRMEATQHDFLDAQRRWSADQDRDFELLEVCTDAEQQLMANFFHGWIANMSLKNLAHSHFRKVLVENDGRSTWYSGSKDLA
jgi:hypothetical protein